MPKEKQEKNLDPTIEELSQEHKTPGYILAGAKHFYKWGAGKRIPETEYLEKIDRFKGSPISERGYR
ncbi:MAG: hypothetical protein QHH10_12075 [Peptococcaceae bacterium]|jgi:hypothetical protein|nr:hypothetical protein [Peptococcaceae bacterium]MDH7526041.1 hypothetical protein [Peptococcaceae bacterium]